MPHESRNASDSFAICPGIPVCVCAYVCVCVCMYVCVSLGVCV